MGSKQLSVATQPKHQKPSRRKKLIGAKRHTPNRATSSVKNSWTSPKNIRRQKRKAEALALREQGYTFEQIGKHMRCSMSCAHGYVVEALREIPLEAAQEVLCLELQRLDGLLSAYYDSGASGHDLPAADMVLKIHDRRARLLGLIPDKPQVGMAVSVGGGDGAEAPTLNIKFVLPGQEPVAELKDVTPRRIEPAPRRDYPVPDPGPVIDAQPLPPTSVPSVGRKRGFNWS
jgi:hypothetical protein